ncbi:MAG: hypothetical protein H7A00_09805 [Hahellaceae bacterium]|nr:hypothetical protein [Hahellaceae bacterium]
MIGRKLITALSLIAVCVSESSFAQTKGCQNELAGTSTERGDRPFWLCDRSLPDIVETGTGESRIAAVSSALASLVQAQYFSVRPVDLEGSTGVHKTVLYRQFGEVEFQGMITTETATKKTPDHFQYVYKISLENSDCEFELKRLVEMSGDKIIKSKASHEFKNCGTAEVLVGLKKGGVTLFDEHYAAESGVSTVLIGYQP